MPGMMNYLKISILNNFWKVTNKLVR